MHFSCAIGNETIKFYIFRYELSNLNVAVMSNSAEIADRLKSSMESLAKLQQDPNSGPFKKELTDLDRIQIPYGKAWTHAIYEGVSKTGARVGVIAVRFDEEDSY